MKNKEKEAPLYRSADVQQAYYVLRETARRESIVLWRIAPRAIAHGCSESLVSAIREEGWDIYRAESNPENLLNPFRVYKYAFRFGEVKS